MPPFLTPINVSEIDSDFRRKSPIFPSPIYLTPPLNGFPLELGIGTRGQKKLEMMGLPDGLESFKISLAVQTPYQHVTDGHLDTGR